VPIVTSQITEHVQEGLVRQVQAVIIVVICCLNQGMGGEKDIEKGVW
jgi:hypothetical protein